MAIHTTNITTVQTSTVNMTGLRSISLGLSLIKACLKATFNNSVSKNGLFDFILILINYLIEKYSAIGPRVNAGKNANAATITITAKTINPKLAVSVFSVPAPSGIYLFSDKIPAIAIGPTIGINLPNNKTIPVLIFHHKVLSPKPSKPLPLFADAEVNS